MSSGYKEGLGQQLNEEKAHRNRFMGIGGFKPAGFQPVPGGPVQIMVIPAHEPTPMEKLQRFFRRMKEAFTPEEKMMIPAKEAAPQKQQEDKKKPLTSRDLAYHADQIEVPAGIPTRGGKRELF